MKIIEIEGIDGVGKTTQCNLLRNRLLAQNKQAIVVKDLESTDIGIQIKQLLLNAKTRSKEVELFSFLACKANLFTEVIVPMVNKGVYVICDRGTPSFVSYFETAGLGREFLLGMVAMFTHFDIPKTTYLLDLDPIQAQDRNSSKQELSKFDNLGLDFFTRQREIFLDIAGRSEDCKILDASQTIQEISELITL
jgi:dTMP kinase